jgi:hypothetical protein
MRKRKNAKNSGAGIQNKILSNLKVRLPKAGTDSVLNLLDSVFAYFIRLEYISD